MKKLIWTSLLIILPSLTVSAFYNQDFKILSIEDSENIAPCSSIMEATQVTFMGWQVGYNVQKMLDTSQMVANGLKQRKVLGDRQAELFAYTLAVKAMEYPQFSDRDEQRLFSRKHAEEYYNKCIDDNLDSIL